MRFVDQVTSEAITEIQSESADLLNLDNVILIGQGMISMADHQRRAELTAYALEDLGYQNFITFFDVSNEVIQIELQMPEGSPQPEMAGLVEAVQTRLQAEQNQGVVSQLQGRAAIIETRDLKLTMLTGSGPIVEKQCMSEIGCARGGNWLHDDGVRECTSGWSVSGPAGDGIITAGHCTGLNQFEEGRGNIFSMNYQYQEYGLGGDVEYHTTAEEEVPEFFIEESAMRLVVDIKTTNSMVGNSVCFYGRSSNTRTCNHVVEDVGVTVKANNEVLVGNLARASNSSAIGGDSGGGWSMYNSAWGVHHGIDASSNGYFTPVEEAQNALGVTIKLCDASHC
ncbi:MAG: S1 family peptidase [Chloroflexales bacterium]|nr:S1 family peptidase [Chloroflexales bacterium]